MGRLVLAVGGVFVGLLASGTLSRKTGGSNASAPTEPHDQIRHSPLTQITKANLNDLGRPWPR